MPEIKVQKVGEHVVVTPGSHEVYLSKPLEFWFENTCGGTIDIMFLHANLLLDPAGAPVPRNGFSLSLNHNVKSEKYKLAAGVQVGEYDYVVRFTVSGSMNTVKARLGNADAGAAIGGSSPRIIVRSSPPK